MSNKRKTTEQFVEQSENKHPGKFSYRHTRYIGYHDKLTVTCLIHGDINVKPAYHIGSKHGCPKCGNQATGDSVSISFGNFIHRSENKFGHNKFSYDKNEYSVYTKPITIKCLTCKKSSVQTPRNHIDSLFGCPYCAGNSPKRKEDYHLLAKNKGYSWCADFAPTSVMDKTKWLCNTCDHVWISRYNDIKTGYGCPQCAKTKMTGRPTMSTDEWVKMATDKHGNRYNYSQSIYVSSADPIKIICKTHGIFKTRPSSHTALGTGCPVCCQSSGEREIADILNKKNVNYQTQKTFDECKNIHKLRFDFYIPGINTLIEYDGVQHFEPVSFKNCPIDAQNKFKKTQANDKIKTQWAIDNGIPLIRIPYTCKDIETELITQITAITGQPITPDAQTPMRPSLFPNLMP